MMMKISEVAISVLSPLKEVIEKLDDTQYGHASALLSGSTIGKHVRHTLEFFDCLLDDLDSGQVNYDHRKRQLIIETSRGHALQLLGHIHQKLEKADENLSLELQADYGDQPVWSVKVATNYHRELVYNIEHAIHHMALIKVGIREQHLDIDLPHDFGVASSTVRFQHQVSKSC